MKDFYGISEGTRTPNPLVRSQVLYPIGLLRHMASQEGFEPPTPSLEDSCSIHLSY